MAEAVHVNRNIVYLGETGFPFGLAPIQRQLLLSLGLIESGAQVLVISNKGVFQPDGSINLSASGNYRGVDYIYTSGEIFRRKNFLSRNRLKTKGLLREFWLLVQLRKNRKIDAAIVATMRFQHILYYYLLSRLLRFKVLLNYVEFNSAISTRTKLRDRINDMLIDRFGVCCADAILPISEYLKRHVLKICPGKPQHKIPIIGDFKPTAIKQPAAPPYFLYCGSASYLELIDFIIASFEMLQNKDVSLYLVVSGDEDDMKKFEKRLQASSASNIHVFSRIPYEELLEKYRQAIGLLIPLRNTIQDIARFPHKIGEYLASGTPVISTNYGEIGHYFTHGENALISDNYDPAEFSEKMKYVLDFPEVARKIGEKGKKLGKELFDYRRQGSALFEFIQKI